MTYLSEHGVVVCRKCKYALHPRKRSIREHFHTIHKSTTMEVRKAIGKYTGTLSLNEVKDVIVPIYRIPTIQVDGGRHACHRHT